MFYDNLRNINKSEISRTSDKSGVTGAESRQGPGMRGEGRILLGFTLPFMTRLTDLLNNAGILRNPDPSLVIK